MRRQPNQLGAKRPLSDRREPIRSAATISERSEHNYHFTVPPTDTGVTVIFTALEIAAPVQLAEHVTRARRRYQVSTVKPDGGS